MALPIWAEFFDALRNDTRYTTYLEGKFDEPCPEVAEVLSCPPRYIPRAKPKTEEAPVEAPALPAESVRNEPIVERLPQLSKSLAVPVKMSAEIVQTHSKKD